MMIAALDLEIAAIRKKGGGTQIELRGGERVGQTEGSWLYRFFLSEDLHLRDDTPVRVTAGQEDVPGVLVSFKDGVLLVALEKDLGPQIAVARLLANDSFLIERLKERLEKVKSGEAQFNRTAGDRVLGLASYTVNDLEPHPSVNADGNANSDQLLAVSRSLGSDTTFIWGPPGTGKTTTLARIVEAHYRIGRTVLLVSNTNIAVDTALQKVAERLKGEHDFHLGLVIRQGPVVKEELHQLFGPQVILEEVVARLSTVLQEEKDKLLQEAAPIEKDEQSLVKALEDIERLNSIREHFSDLRKRIETSKDNIAFRELEAKRYRDRADKIRSDLERARTMGAVRRFFSGLNPERLIRDAAAADNDAHAAIQAAQALASDLPKFEAEIVSLRLEMDRLTTETQRHPSSAEIKVRLEQLRTQLSKIRGRISEINRELAELEQQVLARCKILATTVYRTYLGKGGPRQFDAVVIDEASMLMPPLVYYAAGLSNHSVTVTGDFRQLPPIVMSNEPLAVEWLKCDVFEKAGIPDRLAKHQEISHLVPLSTQYRMREPICDLINRFFYNDRPLRTDLSVNRETSGFPLSNAPLLYVNTASYNPWAALRIGTYSRYNLFHALLVRNIILHLAETDFLPKSGKPNDAVGAVSPYASQARLIQSLLDDHLGSRAAGIAATVHRFQGNEKAAMLLDLTDSTGVRLGRFLQATRLEEDGARLLNVAASRARQHILVIGNFEYLRARAPREGFVRRLVDHFEENGEALDVNTLLPIADREWIDGLHRVFPESFDFPDGAAGAFTETTFYPAFRKDIARARESIVIFSPFSTGNGTTRWVDLLRMALARGVKTRILTRPPNEFGGGSKGEIIELVRELRKLGIAIDLRARMHEKIAIIDGHILWHGSLNILSHRDTHESMLRIESRTACEQLSRFISTPAGKKGTNHSFDESENPECPKCGGPTIWNIGRYGIYFRCENPDCEGKVSGKSGRPGKSTEDGGECPRCGGTLVKRKGRYGQFFGCTTYPECRYTVNME
jgi:hypothetical protein